MKDIVAWFNPYNRQHIRAYSNLRETGKWPDGFLPHDIEIPYGWQTKIAHKIADAWIDENLSSWRKKL